MMLFAVLAVAFFLLNVADLVLTDAVLGNGGRESNPVLRWVMGREGSNWGLFKMGVAVLAVVFLYAFAPPPWREATLGLLIAAWAYVVWHNARVLQRQRDRLR